MQRTCYIQGDGCLVFLCDNFPMAALTCSHHYVSQITRVCITLSLFLLLFYRWLCVYLQPKIVIIFSFLHNVSPILSLYNIWPIFVIYRWFCVHLPQDGFIFFLLYTMLYKCCRRIPFRTQPLPMQDLDRSIHVIMVWISVSWCQRRPVCLRLLCGREEGMGMR